MRTKEILDDGTYIVTNDEQGHAKVNFEFRFKVEGETLFNFTFHTKNLNSKEHLNYSRFLKDIVMKKEFLIYSLKRQIEIVRAQEYQEVDYDASLIDIEIDLYTRLCLIEEYFNVEFEIPDIITQDDSKIIFTLSDLINSKDSNKSWKNSTLSIRVESSVKQSFVDFEKPIQLVIDGEGNVELFGQILKFRHRRVYKTARMRDYERISQMIHLLKGDETIPVKFDPGEDDTYYDIIQRID